MPEEIKEKICEYLKQHKGDEISVKKLMEEMEKEGMKYCYHTILKWAAILNAEPDSNIRIRDYGNIKLISYVGDGE